MHVNTTSSGIFLKITWNQKNSKQHDLENIKEYILKDPNPKL
jgi:hypothetical protein